MEEKRNKGTIKSIENALILLEYLSRKKHGERITRISKDLNLGLTVIHRVLTTLRNRGFIEQEGNTKKYQIGWNARLLGISALGNSELFRHGPSCLEELTKITQETANIVIRNRWEGIYILQAESPNALRVANRVGSRVPLYCTAAGKILLAHMDDYLRQQYYKEVQLVPFSPTTLNTREKIEEQIDIIRKTNIAYDWAEQAIGETCIATPVININDETVAAISISAPASRLTRENSQQFATPLIEAGTRLSERLGFRNKKDSNMN